MSAHSYGLILAGGRGTRFWPRSRKRSAKQVLNVLGDRSLIQQTVDRLTPLIPPERLWVLTNDYLRDTIVRQLPAVPRRQILSEPAPRNTAPAIGLAAHILHSIDPQAVMGVFPSDHVVAMPAPFRATIKMAIQGAKAGNFMVVGIKPRWPETGYGYIEFPDGTKPSAAAGAVRVLRFHEKPPLETAKRYLTAENYYWNSGMFFWGTGALLEQLRQHLPKTATVLASLPKWGSREFSRKLERAFPLCESISIDYAVLEKAGNVSGIAAPDFGWNDVGSWNAVYDLLPKDDNGNVVVHDSVAIDAHNNFVDARGKLVALLGIKDLIVIDTPDALLVAGRARAQSVGEIVKALEKRKRHDLL
jgi:mannose-1-phosphate guanylyltransferase